MYVEHFGFQEDPFGVSPNPRFLYLGPVHQEAFAALLYGVKMRRGFLSMTGDPGTGKTTLLYALRDRLDKSLKSVFLPGTDLTFKQRVQFILETLGVRQPTGTVLGLTRKLQEVLAEEWEAGGNVVLIIDEAQGLTVREMEDIRLLTNFETPQAKLMQVVLVGQPQLRTKLDSPELAQLKQRITVNVTLKPLTLSEMAEYIEHRLHVVGWNRPLHTLFSRPVLMAIFQAAKGNPRLINGVCHNALLMAYAENKTQIDVAMIREAALELELVAESLPGEEPVLEETVVSDFVVDGIEGNGFVSQHPGAVEAGATESEVKAVSVEAPVNADMSVDTEDRPKGSPSGTITCVVPKEPSATDSGTEAALDLQIECDQSEVGEASELPSKTEVVAEESVVEEEGDELVEPEKPTVFISNHESHHASEVSTIPRVAGRGPSILRPASLTLEGAEYPTPHNSAVPAVAGRLSSLMKPKLEGAVEIPRPSPSWWAKKSHATQPTLRQILDEMQAHHQSSAVRSKPHAGNGSKKPATSAPQADEPESASPSSPQSRVSPQAVNMQPVAPVQKTRSSFRLALWVTLLCLATHWAGVLVGLSLGRRWPELVRPNTPVEQPLIPNQDHQANRTVVAEETASGPIPTSAPPAVHAPAPKPEKSETPAKPKTRIVAVRKNDTLGRILRREFGFVNRRLVHSVVAANPDIDDWNYLEVGQRITLPAEHDTTTASSGDNL